MKTRDSLVSNSSSSSFIIAYSLNDKCKHCGRSDPDISNMLNNSSDYSNNRLDAKGKSEVIQFIKITYGDYDSDFIQIIKQIEELSDDMNIIACDISTHDDTLNNFINENNGNGRFKVLYRNE
jgi:hypothetical protein